MAAGRRNGGGGAWASSLLLITHFIVLLLASCTTGGPSVPYAVEEVRREWQAGIDEWRTRNPEYSEYILRTGSGGPTRTESAARRAAVSDAEMMLRRTGDYDGPVEVLHVQTIQKVRGTRYFWLAGALVGINPRRGDVPTWLSLPTDEAAVAGVGVGLTPEEAREEARTSIGKQLSLEDTGHIPYRETDLYRSQDKLFWVRLQVGDEEQRRNLDLIRDRLRSVTGDRFGDEPVVPTLRFLTRAYREVNQSPWRAVATIVHNGDDVLLQHAIEATIHDYLDALSLRLSTQTVTMTYGDIPEVLVELELDSVPVGEPVPLVFRNDERDAIGRSFTYDGERGATLPLRSTDIPVGESVWTVSLEEGALGLDQFPQFSQRDIPHQRLIVERARPRIAFTTAGPDSLPAAELSSMIADVFSGRVEIVSEEPADYSFGASLHISDLREYEGIHFATGTMEIVCTNEATGEITRYAMTAREGGLNARDARRRLQHLLREQLTKDPRFPEIDGIEPVNQREVER